MTIKLKANITISDRARLNVQALDEPGNQNGLLRSG
jgi:hypothetical protein